MTVYILLYLSFYTLNLFFLQYLLNKTFSNKLNLYSLPHIIFYIKKFCKHKYLYLALILNLTGIPPFFLFFVKFNIFFKLYIKVNLIFFFIIFIVLFLNMLFYLEAFYLKNITFNITLLKLKNDKLTNTELFIISFFVGLSYLSVLFFSDIFIIFNLIG